MSDVERPIPRVLVAAVTAYKSRTLDDLAKSVTDDVRAVFSVVRSVMVKAELQYIRQLVSGVATSNEADAVIIVGGTGFGPFDNTCEAIDGFVERRIEGFGEEYRRLLRDEFAAGPSSFLARATAGVYSQCVVFALSGQPAHVRRAIDVLVIPALPDALELAAGRMRTHVGRSGPDSMRPSMRPSVRPRQP
jgi:molybdenum cofactor synthesis domain-containing protein